MTNKTITLSMERQAFEDLVQEKSERFQPYFIRFSDHPDADYKDGTLQWAWELWKARPALAEPVPPAGWEPEVLACIYHGDDHDGKVGLLWRYMPKPDGFSLKFELVDRAHVTRLQAELTSAKSDKEAYAQNAIGLRAEVERLRRDLHSANVALEARRRTFEHLQSELTKARDLLHRAHAADTAGRHELPYNVSRLMDDIEAFLQANQSAPAEKGQGEPVAEIVSKFGDPESFGERELIALKDISKFPYGTKLYAEQPAPVAVVMPDLTELREYHVKAAGELKAYADDSGMRESDVKHYRKRAAVHEAFVAVIDRVKS